jgi:hypothetical protein
LDADPPAQGVNIPCRSTVSTGVSGREDGPEERRRSGRARRRAGGVGPEGSRCRLDCGQRCPSSRRIIDKREPRARKGARIVRYRRLKTHGCVGCAVRLSPGLGPRHRDGSGGRPADRLEASLARMAACRAGPRGRPENGKEREKEAVSEAGSGREPDLRYRRVGRSPHVRVRCAGAASGAIAMSWRVQCINQAGSSEVGRYRSPRRSC